MNAVQSKTVVNNVIEENNLQPEQYESLFCFLSLVALLGKLYVQYVSLHALSENCAVQTIPTSHQANH